MGSLKAAFGLIDSRRSELVSWLRGLLRIDTCNPPGRNYEALVDYIEPRFRELGYTTSRITVPQEEVERIPLPLEGPRVNLVARRDYGCDEDVTIYAHTDTVPVGEGWTRDPFAGELVNGRIYGRGALDMKGTIASLIVALQVMEELKLKPVFNINCMLCTDEEIGVAPGVKYLLEVGAVKGHVLCLEGGAQEPYLPLGMLGDVNVVIEVKGKSVHSGRSFLGVNALEEAIPLLNELMALKRQVEGRVSEVPAMPGSGSPTGRLMPRLSINVMHAGTKANIVPARCEIVVERRYIVEEGYREVEQELLDALERGRKRSRALDITTNIYHIYPAYRVDPDSQYMRRAKEALKTVKGFREEEFVTGGVFASSDMAHVVEELGPGRLAHLGPFRSANTSAHGPDEYVLLEDLVALAKEIVYYLSAPG